MSEKLRPCPFCAGDASVGEGYRGGALQDMKYYSVNCTECGANHDLLADMQVWDREEAIAAWNRRIMPQCVHELVEASARLTITHTHLSFHREIKKILEYYGNQSES